jgi:hypothetical protein
MARSNNETLRDLMRRLLNDPVKRLDKHIVATQLGVSYRVLMHYFGGDPDRRFPAELLPKFCEIVGDYRPLDFLEQEAGRMAFTLPAIEQSEAEQMLEAAKLMKESTEAITAFYKTIEDGRIEERESDATIAELDDVIQHCARLKHWLRHNIGGSPSASAAK